MSTAMAKKSVKAAAREKESKEDGLDSSVSCLLDTVAGSSYLRQKCGSSFSPGIKRNAGNVMRVKVPPTDRRPRMAGAQIPEAF